MFVPGIVAQRQYAAAAASFGKYQSSDIGSWASWDGTADGSFVDVYDDTGTGDVPFINDSSLFYLDSTYSILLVNDYDNTDIVAVLLKRSGTTVTVEDRLILESSGIGNFANGVKVDTDKAIVFFGRLAANQADAVIISRSGDTISKGTATSFDVTGATGRGGAVAMYDVDKGVVQYEINRSGANGDIRGRLFTISGTTITKVGSNLDNSSLNVRNGSALYQIDTEHVLCVTVSNGPTHGDSNANAFIYKISGTTLTAGTTSADFKVRRIWMDKLSDTEFVVHGDQQSSTEITEYKLTVNTTTDTVTIGTKQVRETGSTSFQFTGGSVAWQDDSGYSMWHHCDRDANDFVAEVIDWSDQSGTGNIDTKSTVTGNQYGAICLLDDTSIMCAVRWVDGSNNVLGVKVLKDA